jgi:Pyrimidine dimer DNA glycosylase
MQTFLPLPNFIKSAQCLDYRRLGKQRVECKQILLILDAKKQNVKIGWSSHPAVLQWENYEEALKEYMNVCICEWINRGYKNTMLIQEIANVIYPPWFGDEKYHASHRSNLLRKNFDYYNQFGWEEPIDLEYVWPVKK